MKLYSVSNVAALLITSLGEQAALAAVQSLGGQRIEVPKRVGGKLVDFLGEDVVAVLVEHYSGCRVDMPSRGYIERIHCTIQLRNDVLNSELSANELADKHGVTRAWVHKLRVQLRDTSSPTPKPLKV